jgi:hypothetical protein
MVFPYPYGFILILVPLLSFSWVFSISSTPVLQIANTRNRNNNNNGGNNPDVNPPPPPPPTLEQVLIMQAQLLQTMQHTLVNMQAAPPQALPRHRGIGLESFSALSRLPFLKPWSQRMLTIGSSLWRRSYKWFSAATVRRYC